MVVDIQFNHYFFIKILCYNWGKRYKISWQKLLHVL